ncbi:MAG: sulfotransferase family protein [Candidatus Woesearchaeota archaeon]
MSNKNIIPVFIGGCERSGTSFLASMLGNHPNYITTPECQIKTKLTNLLDWSQPIDQKKIGSAIQFMNHHFRFLIWDTVLNKEDYLNSTEEFSLRSLIEYTVKQYAQQRHNKTNPLVWFDHDPYSLKHRKTILEHFPDARFIHMVRDGRAVATSIMPLDWGPNTIYHAAHFYRKSVSYGLEAEKELPKHQITRVKYEDLIKNPSKELKKICNWLDIEFIPDMLNSKGFIPPKYTRGQHRKVNQKADIKKITSWKQKLNKKQIKIFESIAGKLLNQLEYEHLMPKSTPPNKIRQYIFRLRESYLEKKNKKYMRERKKWGLSQLNRDIPPIENIMF